MMKANVNVYELGRAGAGAPQLSRQDVRKLPRAWPSGPVLLLLGSVLGLKSYHYRLGQIGVSLRVPEVAQNVDKSSGYIHRT